MPARLTLDLALRMTQESLAVAERAGLAMTVAVCDAGGHAILVVRMDEATLVSLDAAPAKARTAVHFRRPTGATLARSRIHPTVYTSFVIASPQPLVLSGGGYPLWDGDDLAGAIAAAGASAAEDGVVAANGLHVWNHAVGASGTAPAPASETDAGPDP